MVTGSKYTCTFISLDTLLKSDVTTHDHMVRCRGSQECGSRNVNFIGDRTEFA